MKKNILICIIFICLTNFVYADEMLNTNEIDENIIEGALLQELEDDTDSIQVDSLLGEKIYISGIKGPIVSGSIQKLYIMYIIVHQMELFLLGI